MTAAFLSLTAAPEGDAFPVSIVRFPPLRKMLSGNSVFAFLQCDFSFPHVHRNMPAHFQEFHLYIHKALDLQQTPVLRRHMVTTNNQPFWVRRAVDSYPWLDYKENKEYQNFLRRTHEPVKSISQRASDCSRRDTEEAATQGRRQAVVF
jgi:hypothetical protein